jgi:hypothetical protein
MGTPLADYIDSGEVPARVIEIGIEIAEALVEVHRAGIIHRDVKPENIIIDRQHRRPVLIDFNIASPVMDVSNTQIGTGPYQPPDLRESGWHVDADTYGLAVSLTELLARRRLRSDDISHERHWSVVRNWLTEAWPFGEDLTRLHDVLLQATQERSTERLTAEDLLDGLKKAGEELARGIPRLRPSPPTYERRSENHNPYMDRLLELFSQSSMANVGTRGLDPFRQWLYLDTRIDRELRPAILRGELKLVVITGNAGDGKTAFIKMVEEELKTRGANPKARGSGNGSKIEYESRTLVTNWDGSQDEGNNANDDVLAEFFAPFAGTDPAPPDQLTHLIAINEGRLIDFLRQRRGEFSWLERNLGDLLDGVGPGVDWLAVVNLNLRTLTGLDDRTSIVGELLSRMSDEELWADCATCVAADLCPARANAATLRDPVLGPRSSDRVRQVLDVVRLRRRLHITMRDLSSALAYVLTGNRSCEEIVELKEQHDIQALLGDQIYNSLFAASDSAVRDVRGAEHDRLLIEVGALDVTHRPEPEEDGRLWALGPQALSPDPEDLDRADRLFIEHLWRAASEDAGEGRSWSGLTFAHASLRRKLFLEREDPAFLDMLPYEHLRSFLPLLSNGADIDWNSEEQHVAEAISRSEGLRPYEAIGVLAVRVVQDFASVDRSFVTRPASDFALKVVDRSNAARYLEYTPDLVRLENKHEGALVLDIDVDLWEAMQRIRAGFTPSREDLRGAWLSLQTFKEAVASVPSRQLLLQPQGGRTARIRIDDSGRIVAGMM